MESVESLLDFVKIPFKNRGRDVDRGANSNKVNDNRSGSYSGDGSSDNGSGSCSGALAMPEPLQGRVIVFTGKMLSMTRQEASEICERMGGTTQSGVTATTNLLVDCNWKSSSGEISLKAKKAKKHGIEVWDEEQWLLFVENYGIEESSR